MNQSYDDIRSRITEPPRWWDEEAVPRYCDFQPEEASNIYADIVVLLAIECQNCQRPFRVAMSENARDWKDGFVLTPAWVQTLHYGDPPNVGCCPAGPTMNSVPRHVVECWRRDLLAFEWRRLPELEVPIECEWAPQPEKPE